MFQPKREYKQTNKQTIKVESRTRHSKEAILYDASQIGDLVSLIQSFFLLCSEVCSIVSFIL